MPDDVRKLGVRDLRRRKQAGEKIVAITAYDSSMARLVDEAGVDLVLVEGYKKEPIPKIFVIGSEEDGSILGALDPHVIALVSDRPRETHLPVFSISDVGGLADLVIDTARPAFSDSEGQSPASAV